MPNVGLDNLILQSELEEMKNNGRKDFDPYKDPNSLLGRISGSLTSQWQEPRLQHKAVLGALNFLTPPPLTVPTQNLRLQEMGLREINPQALEMLAMGAMTKLKGVGKLKTTPREAIEKLQSKAQVSKPLVPKNLDERREFFSKEIAQAQRGAPETKMVELQHVAGGGQISYVSERVGDLIDRIYGTPQQYGGRKWAWEATGEKINKSLHELTSKYGFQREVTENAITHAKYRGISLEAYQGKVDKALKEYADAHRNIPTYNEVQKLANDAAVAFGEKNFDLTIKNLKILRNYMDEGFESWEKRVYSLKTPKTKQTPTW
jgi:hypothetical protein